MAGQKMGYILKDWLMQNAFEESTRCMEQEGASIYRKSTCVF